MNDTGSKKISWIRNRFFLFFTFVIALLLVNFIFSGSVFPGTHTKELWFYSGILMVLFSTLFIEPYYTSPKNVITNTIPLFFVFLSIENTFENKILWWIAVTIILVLLFFAICVMALEDKNKSPDHWRNKNSVKLKKFIVFFGKGKIIYSAVFFLFLYVNITSKPSEDFHQIFEIHFVALLIIWGLILAIDPKEINNTFFFKKQQLDRDAIGEIFSVQSKKIFLIKIFEDRKYITKFNLVKFRYSMQDRGDLVFVGIVFDTYYLNQEKWAKILELGSSDLNSDVKFEKDIIYNVSEKQEIEKLSNTFKIDNLVGIVVEGSNIGKIKFEYSKKNDDLQEGELLELKVENRRLFYQVINGRTEKEKLENRNEAGFVEGEAIQLGEWQNDKLSFQKFGWVPSINTAIFKADTSSIQVEHLIYPDYKIGVIPGTSLPSVLNLGDAVSHHMALLGVTGSGKSYLARDIIEQIKVDTKIICIDFNKEFITTLSPAPTNIISNEKSTEISEKIDWINNELDEFANKRDKPGIATKQNEIKSALKTEIENFLSDQACNIKVFELPDVSNTTGILDYTKYFFRVLFEIAKDRQISNNSAKICVVLEEAHTIIPEWNFSGSGDKTSQSLVNSIGQIALQGRKYGIGFLVIAQRTANVSKTVLTQCNTVVCFQAFDETSFNFLGNYVGKEMVQILPNLKQYHAIVAGKAVKSNMPLIIDLKR